MNVVRSVSVGVTLGVMLTGSGGSGSSESAWKATSKPTMSIQERRA